jgi:putative ABC transport system permease protein
MGTVLGIGSFVAVLGITSTANGQITEQFNALAATQVSVRQVQSDGSQPQVLFPADAETRVGRLNGVKHSGLMWSPDEVTARKLPPVFDRSEAANEAAVPVLAVSPGLWTLLDPAVVQGRTFDPFLASQPVAVLGESIAKQFGISDLSHQPVIFLSDHPFVVVGIISNTKRLDDPASAVTIPTSVAYKYWGAPSNPPEMTIETSLGAAPVVAKQAPLAIDAVNPSNFASVSPADPKALQSNISTDLRSLFLALAGICLFVGAVGIANANLLAVMERIPEIGLRRSLGAMPRHIGTQFLTESTILGGFGGTVGSMVGTASVVAASVAKDWTPVIEPATIIAAPLLGAGVGLLAGLYPALRASRIEPVEAFRK